MPVSTAWNKDVTVQRSAGLQPFEKRRRRGSFLPRDIPRLISAIPVHTLKAAPCKTVHPYRALMSCPRNKHIFRCDQNGPPARREEDAYPERYVTDEQRGRRPIFIATLWAA